MISSLGVEPHTSVMRQALKLVENSFEIKFQLTCTKRLEMIALLTFVVGIRRMRLSALKTTPDDLCF